MGGRDSREWFKRGVDSVEFFLFLFFLCFLIAFRSAFQEYLVAAGQEGSPDRNISDNPRHRWDERSRTSSLSGWKNFLCPIAVSGVRAIGCGVRKMFVSANPVLLFILIRVTATAETDAEAEGRICPGYG